MGWTEQRDSGMRSESKWAEVISTVFHSWDIQLLQSFLDSNKLRYDSSISTKKCWSFSFKKKKNNNRQDEMRVTFILFDYFPCLHFIFHSIHSPCLINRSFVFILWFVQCLLLLFLCSSSFCRNLNKVGVLFFFFHLRFFFVSHKSMLRYQWIDFTNNSAQNWLVFSEARVLTTFST